MTIFDSQRGYQPARHIVDGHSPKQREILLIIAVQHAQRLDNMKPSERKKGNMLAAPGSPHLPRLRKKETGIDQQAEAEKRGDNLFEFIHVQLFTVCDK
jgi:hypothetical protein